jgi:hypothetical protein
MRIIHSTLAISAALILAAPLGLLAQTLGPAPSQGLFGPRTLGQTLKPRPSYFTNSLQRGPSGNFLSAGRPSGNMFATPWRQTLVPTPYVYEPPPPLWAPPEAAAQPIGENVPQQEMATPEGSPEDYFSPPAAPSTTAEPFAPEYGAPVYGVPAYGVPTYGVPGVPAPALPAAPAGGAPEATVPMSGMPAFPYNMEATAPQASAPPRPTVRFVGRMTEDTGLMPAVSARLTSIARSHGVQITSPIKVNVVNGTAVLRGTVGTEQDRSLIGNVARLEPGIWRIENRLTVVSEMTAGGTAKK